MTVQINGAHDHSDEEIVLVFASGKRHTLQTCASIDYENGGESGQIDGNQAGPVALTAGKRSPKWSGEIAKWEHTAIVKAMGAGYTRQNIQILVSYRPVGDLPRINDEIQGARMTTDGTKSSTGNPALVSIGGKALKVLFDGIDPDPAEAA